jgi:hypothetical protein
MKFCGILKMDYLPIFLWVYISLVPNPDNALQENNPYILLINIDAKINNKMLAN